MYFCMITQLNIVRFIGPRHNSPGLPTTVNVLGMFMQVPQRHRIDETVNHVTHKYY